MRWHMKHQNLLVVKNESDNILNKIGCIGVYSKFAGEQCHAV